MSFADGSQVRLADVSETVIGTIPATPAFQIMRYRSSSIRLAKQVDISDEVRADRNVPGITDVGRNVAGSIETRFSYGTYDAWLERLLCSAFSTGVLKNGVTHKTGTLEATYEQGATVNGGQNPGQWGGVKAGQCGLGAGRSRSALSMAP